MLKRTALAALSVIAALSAAAAPAQGDVLLTAAGRTDGDDLGQSGARALGAALLPLYLRFAPDRDRFLKIDE